MSSGAPPTIPASLQLYNSYVEDPIWQGTFTAIWCSCLGAVLLVSLPSLVHALRHGRALAGFFGVTEGSGTRGYSAVISEEKTSPSPSQPPKYPSTSRKMAAYRDGWSSVWQWSVPYLGLTAGQVFVLAAYTAITLTCIIKDAPLVFSPNRAGFLVLAQFPVVFLFATKNSLLSFLLGPGHGYEKLNFIHRMAGRIMFLAAGIHGGLWIRNHIQYGLPILGPQKETSGVASFAVLGCIVLFSIRPIRRWCYQAFFVIHVLTFVAFFVCVCYHTIYAPPWIFPPLAFYAADMLLRLLRYRFKDATAMAPDKSMTLVRIHDCNEGWIAGQHVCVRVFFSGRVMESHPLSILSAPPAYSCLSNPGLLLGARVNGDWTSALNTFVREEQERLITPDGRCKVKDAGDHDVSVPIQVMIDGPYGGSSVDLGQYETVLLVSGGSGITFTLGLLDDIVGRCIKLRRRGGERTRRIEFAWCIRSFGNVPWFAPMLTDIANTAVNSSIDLHVSIFITCACQPGAMTLIPNCDVTFMRPSIYALLQDLTNSRSTLSSSMDSVEEQRHGMERIETSDHAGGVAVCASGPAGLTTEAQNAVARLGIMRGVELGGVAIHTEQFAM